jgi:recombinational DNA repair ATPase RecF
MFNVGANALGKSNFLDALWFIRDIAKYGGGLQYAILPSFRLQMNQEVLLEETYNNAGLSCYKRTHH